MPEVKTAVVLSLRAKWCPELFSGRKRIEYRKFFPADFSGRIYVYECGPDSRHRIIGLFDTANIARWNPEYLDNDDRMQDLVKCFEYAGAPDSELEDMCVNEDVTLVCIPVKEPRLLKVPLTLKEWSALHKASPVVDFPPMSWQKCRIDYSVPDDTWSSATHEGADIGSRKQYTSTTKKQPDLFEGGTV